jgi:hypothetical protein
VSSTLAAHEEKIIEESIGVGVGSAGREIDSGEDTEERHIKEARGAFITPEPSEQGAATGVQAGGGEGSTAEAIVEQQGEAAVAFQATPPAAAARGGMGGATSPGSKRKKKLVSKRSPLLGGLSTAAQQQQGGVTAAEGGAGPGVVGVHGGAPYRLSNGGAVAAPTAVTNTEAPGVSSSSGGNGGVNGRVSGAGPRADPSDQTGKAAQKGSNEPPQQQQVSSRLSIDLTHDGEVIVLDDSEDE